MKSTTRNRDQRSQQPSNAVRPAWTLGFSTIGVAIVASAAIWLIAHQIGNQELSVAFADQAPQKVDLIKSIVTPVVVGLLGMGLLVLLAKFTSRAGSIWTTIASIVLLISMAGPITAQAETGTKLVLIALHTVVGVILILGLPRVLRGSQKIKRT